MAYIYSTASGSVEFVLWSQGEGIPRPLRTVKVNGGANVITKYLVTPKGVVTEVSDDDLEWIEKEPVFQSMQSAGILLVQKRRQDADAVAEKMTPKDGFAQLTPGKTEYDRANEAYIVSAA